MEPYFSSLTRGLSAERFESYKLPNENYATASDLLTRYLWNLALCEAFYPSLHCLEVTLRNSIDAAATKRFGVDWLALGSPYLVKDEQERVVAAIAELRRQSKPTNHGRVVAVLEFSFWTRLFSVEYRAKFWPPIIAEVFPHISRRQRTFQNLAYRLNQLRRFRNRVYHYEPIWRQDTRREHAMIVETVGWMNTEIAQALSLIDRFADVDREGIALFRARVEQFLGGLTD